MNDRGIASAINIYAVMLDRPAWLDPARMEAQMAVWSKLAGGPLSDDDVVEAIQTLLANGERRDVLPSSVVGLAKQIAAERAAKVGQLIAAWEFSMRRPNSDLLLLREASAFNRDPDIVAGVGVLRDRVEKLRREVIRSETLDPERMALLFAALDKQVERIISARPPSGVLYTDAVDPVQLDAAARMWRDEALD
jgi:hypothetical protein